MGTLRIDLNKFLGTFGDVINMMTDVGLLSSHVYSYAVTQDMSNMVIEERHLQAFLKFLDEAKILLNQLTNQLSLTRKEGFQGMVLGFEGRQSIAPDGRTSCPSEVKSHGSSFSSSCENSTFAQMKNTSGLDVRFSSSTQQYDNLNETRCEMSSGRFSPIDETQFNTADTLSQSRHYAVNDGNTCYDMAASSVGHENSLSSHGAGFNLPDHMVVNQHFQSNCDTAFDGSANQMMQFPSCSRDTSMKQFPSAAESQNHDSQYVSHDKSQDFSSKPSCEFAQPPEAGDSQHFTSPRGHFSPTTESNCETLYASRCETTQDAHFSCDTAYETSNHSGRGIHAPSVSFQTSREQSMNAHYSHPSLPNDARFCDSSKNPHASAFSMVNSISSAQYSSCQSRDDKTPFISNENAQNKMHFPSRDNMCEQSFPPLNGSNNFVGVSNTSCSTHVTSRGVDGNRYPHVSSFKWDVTGVISDTEDDFDHSSPVQESTQSQESSDFGDLQMTFSNQAEKNVPVNGLKRNTSVKNLEPGENTFSVLLGARAVSSLDQISKKKLTVLDGLKQESGKWKCPMCAKLFITRINFERHFKVSHLGEKGFPCHLCDKGFSSKIRLEAHLMRQHNLNLESANPCSVCGKPFNTKTALKTHSLTHVDESEKPFACSLCHKRFSQKVVLNSHLLRHEGPDAYKHICKICSKSFPTKAKLKFHCRKHESAHFSCKECPKQFPHESLLRAHEATHLAFSERPYQCSQCPKTFTTKHKLQMHSETHGSANQYSCSECSSVFKCRSTLVAHTRRRHQKMENAIPSMPECSDSNVPFSAPPQLTEVEQPQGHSVSSLFKCPVCFKEFKHKRNLKDHQISVHQDVPQRFTCEHCPKRFKSKSKLKVHLTSHTTEPNLACRTCGKRFYRTDFLRSHEATHTGNKPFSCDVCARRFVTQSKLRTHQVIHQPAPENSAEVPCQTCGKKFKNKRTLALHIKCHADSLEFKCGSCGKEFARRVHFEGHMRTHSGDRPYSCTVCNRTFRERKHRKDHMRRLHPNEILGGGEMTLQKLIDSITADDTMEAPAGGGSFETDVNSDALATLTELSNSGMQHLLEESSHRNGDSQIDDTSQSQSSQMNTSFGSQTSNLPLESSVDVNQSTQVNHISQPFTSQSHVLNLDCQTDLSSTNLVHPSEQFPSQSQNLSMLQTPFHHLKSRDDESNPFNCSISGTLSPLPELPDQLQSIATHSCSHPTLHPHFTRTCESTETPAAAGSDESLPKLSDVLAISMQGDI